MTSMYYTTDASWIWGVESEMLGTGAQRRNDTWGCRRMETHSGSPPFQLASVCGAPVVCACTAAHKTPKLRRLSVLKQRRENMIWFNIYSLPTKGGTEDHFKVNIILSVAKKITNGDFWQTDEEWLWLVVSCTICHSFIIYLRQTPLVE